MNKLNITCAAIAAAAVAVSVYQWRESRADHELIAALRSQLAAGQARAGNRKSDVGSGESQDTKDVVTDVPAPVEQSAALNYLARERDSLKDPEQRKARLAQQRLRLPQSYPGLASELALTSAEADQFWQLLAEFQLEQGAHSVPAVNGVMDPHALRESGMKMQELQRNYETSVAALLGEARYQQWQDYQETRPGRVRAVQIGRALESMSLPLNDAQMRSLTTALIAEQKLKRESGMLNVIRRDLDSATIERMQAESNQRVIATVTSSLNAQQLEALRASLGQ